MRINDYSSLSPEEEEFKENLKLYFSRQERSLES